MRKCNTYDISPDLLQDAEIGGCVRTNTLQRKENERVLRKTSDAKKFRRQKMQRPPTLLFPASDLSIFVAISAKKRSRLFPFSREFAMGVVVVSLRNRRSQRQRKEQPYYCFRESVT